MKRVFACGLVVAVACFGTTAFAQDAVTDVSAARKKHKKPKAAKEEYLKAAPGTGPSGPKK